MFRAVLREHGGQNSEKGQMMYTRMYTEITSQIL